MRRTHVLYVLIGVAMSRDVQIYAPYEKKSVIAHRGASAYAPEHTRAAYRLAIEQKADFVEQDLQISRDGVLVCLHDLTLERTTDVEQVFPERYRREQRDGASVRTWWVSDFTLAELRQLDAGSWFGKSFAGERIPTFQEAIDLVRGKAGLYPETKEPAVYGARGLDMEGLLIPLLERNRLAPRDDPRTPVIIQSFSPASLQKLRKAGLSVPLVLLIDDEMKDRWATDAGLQEAARFATGIGPKKEIVLENPDIVRWAHALGLSVTPYTFKTDRKVDTAAVREEMSRFLYRFQVDAVFTDNPDLFPRQ